MKIGTRGSPLALAQALQTRAALADAQGAPHDDHQIVAMTTTGDMILDRALSQAGGKGLFTKELDAALLDGRVDFAVHSSKDLPTALPEGIVIAGYLPREDVRDAFVSRKARSLAQLPEGARLGTASLRRGAMAKRLRPDLDIVLLRGNVQTRLRKLDEGEADATLLALAGLKRLGLTDVAASILDTDTFLPAVGQGAIGITARAGDDATLEALASILDRDTAVALAAERAFLEVLDGSCRTPIGGLALIEGDTVKMRGVILRPDGSEHFESVEEGPLSEAALVGARLGARLKSLAPADFFSDGAS